MKPGDRRQRWNEAHGISGFIFLLMTGVLIANGQTATYIMACGTAYMAYLDFRDINRGWKMLDGPSPMSKKHDLTELKRKKGLYSSDEFWENLKKGATK